MGLSVLMSVYYKESPDYLRQALQSLVDQTQQANEVVLVEDGPIGSSLASVINDFRRELNIVSVSLERNVGLGRALNEGLKYCKYELVARMDSDDISLPERFSSQVSYMTDNPDIAASSAIAEEWNGTMSVKQGVRRLPLNDIDLVRFAKKRSPLSHPVTIFRKSVVQSVGGYPPLRKAQDYALWSLLICNGFKLSNLPQTLLRMRTGDEMLARRGWSYFKEEYKLLKFQKDIGFLSQIEFMTNVFLKGGLRLSPNFLKRLAYKLAR